MSTPATTSMNTDTCSETGIGAGTDALAQTSASTLHEQDEAVLEPMRYLEAQPGKDVRGQLIDCFQQWLRIPQDKVEAVKAVVTDLHNASLLVDDIEDNSRLRRGMPVAHSVFGVPATLNCANYVYVPPPPSAPPLSEPLPFPPSHAD